MTTTDGTSAIAGRQPRRMALRIAGTGLVAFGVFLSGFVISEPAPYEVYMAALIGGWFLLGLPISRTTGVLLAFMLVFMTGGFLSLTQMAQLGTAPVYMGVTLFLALSSVFYSAIIEDDWRRLPLMFNAWVAAAVLTSLLGIAGYFGLFPGAEAFTLYDRAKGAFQDPNVFGPFLVAPALYLIHGILTGRAATFPIKAACLGIITIGILLSFSRAAWALFVFAAMAMVLLMFIKQREGKFRLKIISLALCGAIVAMISIIAALQIPQVSDLLANRTKLVQDYDGGKMGRFERHKIGFRDAMSQPLGIGPLVFGKTWGEDEHNIWLKSLTSYGWLGFIAYVSLALTTIAYGFRYLLRDRPWQPYLLVSWIVLVGHQLIGNVIDTDHWRHHFMLYGIVWGCIALEHAHRRKRAAKTRTT